MDASQRLNDEFARLIARGGENVTTWSYAERIVFYVVVARCEKDMAGFSSIYEQALTSNAMATLVDGLRKMDEPRLASTFQSGLEELTSDGFYTHLNWRRVSESVKARINELGDSIGDELWGLDQKLVALLDSDSLSRTAR